LILIYSTLSDKIDIVDCIY